SLAEDHFEAHFPGYPVMPACLILEGLAQTGGILVGEANQFKEKVVLAKVPRATFHREMLAGETLVYEAEVVHMRPEGASVSARVLVDGQVTAEADWSIRKASLPFLPGTAKDSGLVPMTGLRPPTGAIAGVELVKPKATRPFFAR
ncbi:MAG: hypothetical protein HC869_24795, partial [Rhodospirillales bacterium]|nr:hypothetical protein [Rhodospirillales bacterium]